MSDQLDALVVEYMRGVVKTLRRSNSLSRSVFSTAGSFGLACGRQSRHPAVDLYIASRSEM